MKYKFKTGGTDLGRAMLPFGARGSKEGV